ncbi:MAG TPA: hypothetical protein EYO33_15235 [Phycisphaerales bacterium]|nr:hypothetical protein [Phycisphaerales bacterium]
MKDPFLPLPIGWLRHPLRLRLLQKDVSHESRFFHLILVVAESRQPGRLVAFDNRPKTVQDLSWDHDRDLDSWNAFMDFAEEIGLIEKDGETWVITDWKLFSRDPVAEEKDRHRKQMERRDAELEKLRSELQRMAEEVESENSCPNISEDVQQRPRASRSIQGRPKPSKAVQKTPPIDIDLDLEEDLDLQKDKRSDNTACAETALHLKASECPSGPPATWDARLFKKTCSIEDVVTKGIRDYVTLAKRCNVSPIATNSEMKMSLLRILESGDWRKYEDDPLVQLVALKMGINQAFVLYSEGFCDEKSVCHFAMQDAERCLPAAKTISDINRDAIDLDEPLITPKEAFKHIPTTLEKQLVDTS